MGHEKLRGAEVDERPNNGMNLTRVGAGSQGTRRGGGSSWIAAQVMPGVGRTSWQVGAAEE